MAITQHLKKPVIFTTNFNTYTAAEIIGEGGSGRIYKAIDDSDGTTYAIKRLNHSTTTEQQI